MELTQDMLAEIFAGRPNRFRLLDAGVIRAGWTAGTRLLEIGCNTGDAAAHLAEARLEVTAADIDEGRVLRARAAHADAPGCRFIKADAAALPFEGGSFDGVYSEAAFSVLPDKAAALSEYFRLLRPGGRVLINDFALRRSVPADGRAAVAAVPCFAGALTMAEYGLLFRRGGFAERCGREEFYEFASIFANLASALGVKPRGLGGALAEGFGGERAPGESFFEKAGLSYCQMIFEKA